MTRPLGILVLVVPTVALFAQDMPSVWSGVYTAAQADRGKAVYAGHCSRCHGDDLTGPLNYPLAGERFMDHWEAHTLGHLFLRDSRHHAGRRRRQRRRRRQA